MKVHRGMRRALAGATAASLLAVTISACTEAQSAPGSMSNFEARCEAPGLARGDSKTLTGFDLGCAAYASQQYEQAIDIWQRYAVAGDVRSQWALGEVYSNHGNFFDRTDTQAKPEVVKLDLVQALTWYGIAANYDFERRMRFEGTEISAQERNASIKSEHRLPKVRALMSDADVTKAETAVSETFQRGSPYDLYRLGEMHQSGSGVRKDNSKAHLMYSLARARGVAEAAVAVDQVEKLMTRVELKLAAEQYGTWQPPLPVELVGQTPQMVENERLKKELEEIKLEEALEAVADIDVELLQRALRALGFYYGAIDNNMGPETREAIRRFQYSGVAQDTEMSEADKEAVRTGVLSARQTVRLIGAAAGASHPMSQYVYGVMHARGIGVVQDGQEAVNWLNKAAGADLALAHYALGVIYRDGTTGLNEVTPTKALAAQHFARAYALGYAPAGEALRLLSFEAPRNVE